MKNISRTQFSSALIFSILCMGIATNITAQTEALPVRPDYTLVELRQDPFRPSVTDFAWYGDDTLLIAEWSKDGVKSVVERQFNGTIYMMTGVEDATGPGDVEYHIFADDLEVPTGMVVLGDTVYVSSGFTLDGHIDTDKDGVADDIHNVYDFAVDIEQKCRHEFFHGLVYQEPLFYATYTSCKDDPNRPGGVHGGTWQRNKVAGGSYTFDRYTGERTLVATGFRSSYGMGVGPEGGIWHSENNGAWLPSNKLFHVQEGKFYGFRADNWTLEEHFGSAYADLEETPPSIWVQHNSGGKSPGHPLLVEEGIFAGQLLVGDVATGNISRAYLQKVEGEWQGAYFHWGGGFEEGPGTLLWGKNGQLIVGQVGNGDRGNWGWSGEKTGLQKYVPKANAPVVFEPLAIRSRNNGLEIEFTLPVDETAALNTAFYSLERSEEVPAQGYGAGQRQNISSIEISGATLSPDKKSVLLEIDIAGQIHRAGALQPNTVVFVDLSSSIKSESGADLWVEQSWVTLNAISTSSAFEPDVVPVNKKNPALNFATINKVDGIVNVSVEGQGPHRVEIANLNGRIVTQKSGTHAGLYQFTNLSKGKLYIVNVRRGGGLVTKKVAVF